MDTANINSINEAPIRKYQFVTEKSFLTRLFSETKIRTFKIEEPVLGTLQRLCLFDEFSDDPIPEVNEHIPLKYAWNSAKILALATMNNLWGNMLLTQLFALYLLWKLPVRRIISINRAYTIYLANLEDFAKSISMLNDLGRILNAQKN